MSSSVSVVAVIRIYRRVRANSAVFALGREACRGRSSDDDEMAVTVRRRGNLPRAGGCRAHRLRPAEPASPIATTPATMTSAPSSASGGERSPKITIAKTTLSSGLVPRAIG